MRKIISLILCLFIVCLTLFGCNPTEQGLVLHETPQTYVLQDEDSYAFVDRVTLYENGDAILSLPVISCYANENARYEIDGNELIVTNSDNLSVTFTISDSGDTITIKSSTFFFTKPGFVYKYQPASDLISKYENIFGETMT